MMTVRSNYLNVYKASLAEPMAYSGNVAGCVVGSPGDSYRRATVAMLNYYRELVGLPAVSLDLAASNTAQGVAMMMMANNRLDLQPSSSWRCYSDPSLPGEPQARATAAWQSTMSRSLGAKSIVDQMNSVSALNGIDGIGNRRQVLYPRLSSVGVGSVPDPSGAPGGVNAILSGVVDQDARPATPHGVAWPSPGYFPLQNLPPDSKWSYSIKPPSNGSPGTLYTDNPWGTTGGGITVTKDGVPLQVTITPDNTGDGAPNYGGDKGVVFEVHGVDYSHPATYTVTVHYWFYLDSLTSLVPDGGHYYTYQVRTFDPEQ